MAYSECACCSDSLCLQINLSDLKLAERAFYLRTTFPPDGEMGSIKDCNFNPQIEKAITIENGRAIKIWDFNGKLFDSLKAEASVSFVSIGKDPALFFTGDDKGRVTAWPLNGYVPRTLIAHPKKITGLRVSEGDNGRFIISSSRKGANVLNLADSSIHFY
ncbi:MAG TPA: hypothetical protein PLU64_00305, partial [Saprospiraceae bacterium]|nr:hypothetical protein [Saprospiraceae bacterium]